MAKVADERTRPKGNPRPPYEQALPDPRSRVDRGSPRRIQVMR